MAVQQTQTLPPQFIQDLGTDLSKQILAQTGVPTVATGLAGISQQPGESAADFAARQQAAREFTTRQQSLSGLAPTAEAQDRLQGIAQSIAEQQAGVGTAQQGLGTFQPFLDRAQDQSAEALRLAGAAETGLAGIGTGATAFQQDVQQFMSPYQSQVIDASLAEFDRNAQIREQQIRDQQAKLGQLGSGRAGVQLAELGTGLARERALLQAGLLQQGFNQASAQRQQDIANRFGLSQAQLGVGQAESGLAAALPGLQRADVAQLGTLGALNQAQAQAQLDAQREAARQAAFLPQEQLDRFAGQVTGLMGGYPGQTQQTVTPNPTPLQSALGIGSTLAGIYGAVTGSYNPANLLRGGNAEGGRAGYKDGTGEEGIMKMASGDDPLLVDEYEKYVFEMEEMGKEPMSFEMFKAMVLSGQG